MANQNYQFEYWPYQRPFRQPLQTHHGEWKVREGIILRLTNELGQIGWGEIAPLPWFGSETWEQAWDWCQQLPPKLSPETISKIPAHLPACQFGFESALDDFWQTKDPIQTFSGLLPTGAAALKSWPKLWEQGYRTFKWKIGVQGVEVELELFQALRQQFPATAQLRLDANGGLTRSQAHQWLQVCAQNQGGQSSVEYLEQPLPPEHLDQMQQLAEQYATPIALDESVTTLAQLQICYHQGWRGVYVIKPAIAGFPSHLRQFCQEHPIDAVFSSVFETDIGRQAGLRLAIELGNPKRAHGYGTNHWFDESTPHPKAQGNRESWNPDEPSPDIQSKIQNQSVQASP